MHAAAISTHKGSLCNAYVAAGQDLGKEEKLDYLRAILPNPDNRIYPGLFARIRVPGRVTPNAVLASTRWIRLDPRSTHTYPLKSTG